MHGLAYYYSYIYCRFELAQAVEGEVPLLELGIILRIKDGIKLMITPREL